MKFNKIISSAELVIGALPGYIGFENLKKVIKYGKNIVDISFFNEDPFLLDDLAKNNNVTAVVDCGIAPGLSNLILGFHYKKMKIESFSCYVGGLPFKRTLPYQYKAPFSPIDVIEEYMRPARIMKNGKIIIKEALTNSELLDFDGIGTLEAFNTDGLRTLLKTVNIPNMIEKTLRYPGHIDYIKLLKTTGFFNAEEIDVKGIKIRPLDLSIKLLFPHWQLEQDEEEFTILKVIIRGSELNKIKTYNYFLFDKYDSLTKTTSMARTTGYTCAAVARLILNGNYNRKGIIPPEYIGEEENCFDSILKHLSLRGIELKAETL